MRRGRAREEGEKGREGERGRGRGEEKGEKGESVVT